MLIWSYPDNLRQYLKGFHVFRSRGDGFVKTAFVAKDKTEYVDSRFRENITYRYKVVAQSVKNVLSEDSNIVTALPRIVPSPPDDIRFEIKADFILLSWKSSDEGVCYNIYKTTEKGVYSGVPLNSEPVCDAAFKDNVLLPDKAVYYSLRAVLNTAIKDEGYASKELMVRPSHFLPSPPADLRIVPGDDRTYLMWEPNPESWVRGYRVYRKTDKEAEFKYLGEVKIPAFIDTDRKYKKAVYMIKALGPLIESGSLTGEVSVSNNPAN